MNTGRILENARALVSRRLDRELESVDAVYDDQLWKILDAYGLLAKLDAGELRCHMSGVPLTRDNVGGLIGSPDGPRLICGAVEAAEAAG